MRRVRVSGDVHFEEQCVGMDCHPLKPTTWPLSTVWPRNSKQYHEHSKCASTVGGWTYFTTKLFSATRSTRWSTPCVCLARGRVPDAPRPREVPCGTNRRRTRDQSDRTRRTCAQGVWSKAPGLRIVLAGNRGRLSFCSCGDNSPFPTSCGNSSDCRRCFSGVRERCVFLEWWRLDLGDGTRRGRSGARPCLRGDLLVRRCPWWFRLVLECPIPKTPLHTETESHQVLVAARLTNFTKGCVKEWATASPQQAAQDVFGSNLAWVMINSAVSQFWFPTQKLVIRRAKV